MARDTPLFVDQVFAADSDFGDVIISAGTARTYAHMTAQMRRWGATQIAGCMRVAFVAGETCEPPRALRQ